MPSSFIRYVRIVDLIPWPPGRRPEVTRALANRVCDNDQDISTGNIQANRKADLILMDHPKMQG